MPSQHTFSPAQSSTISVRAMAPVNQYHSFPFDDGFLPRPPSQLGDRSSANSPVSVSSFPDHHQMADVEMAGGFCDYQWRLSAASVTGGGQELDYCGQLVANLCWPTAGYNTTAGNWVIVQGKASESKGEEQAAVKVKVGRYSVEEKKDRILRYLKKRNQRNFNKTIKYACRKTLADKRVRVRGRFAKNNEEDTAITTTSYPHQQNHSISQDSYQMTYDDDDWLQTALANLMHLPYLGS